MAHGFHDIFFIPRVKALQQAAGSRASYARLESWETRRDRLGEDEAAFLLSERDNFYLASVGEGGWPYMQHRGGPTGSVRVLDEKTIGFADCRGNRQFVTDGNLQSDDRVVAIVTDYARRARLKVLGRARLVDIDADRALTKALDLGDNEGSVERLLLIAVEAVDWHCSQHITPRFTMEEVRSAVTPLHARIGELEAALQAANAKLHSGSIQHD